MAHVSVLLGVPDGPVQQQDKTTWNINKIGGFPDWFKRDTPTPCCHLCLREMTLIMQLYCPLGGSLYHRCLHIFVCPSKCCSHNVKGWRVVRTQVRDQTVAAADSKVPARAGDWLQDDDWGQGQDDWGQGQDDWGQGQDDLGQGQDDWGQVQDDSGQGQDTFKKDAESAVTVVDKPEDDVTFVSSLCDLSLETAAGSETFTLDFPPLPSIDYRDRISSATGIVAADLVHQWSVSAETSVSFAAALCDSQDVDCNRRGDVVSRTDVEGCKTRGDGVSRTDVVEAHARHLGPKKCVVHHGMSERAEEGECEDVGEVEVEAVAVESDCVQRMMEILATAADGQMEKKDPQPVPSVERVRLPAFYLQVYEESDEAAAVHDPHVTHLLQDYHLRDGKVMETLLQDDRSVPGVQGDGYEKAEVHHGNRMHYKFLKKMAQCPAQCVRYSWKGEPLLIDSMQAVSRRCMDCGADLVFELQLTPPVINLLKLTADSEPLVEFGTVLVYSCSRSCWDDSVSGTREEFLVLQQDPDSHLFQ